MARGSSGTQNDNFLSNLMNSLAGGAGGNPSASMNPPSYGGGMGRSGMGGFGGMGGGAGIDPGLMGMDPLSEEYQKALENRIKQNNVNENAEYAHQFNPELYTHTTMLYIECSINGNEIQAFVDSGAQSTIMSQRCAEKCNLLKLLDTRMSGMAQGVGTCKILGRVHAAQIQVGDRFFTTSLTILEDNKVDMLFGLDNLKRHRCCIDLDKNELTLDQGKVSVPFLKDDQIVRGFGEESKEEMSESGSKSYDDKLTELMAMGYEEKQ